MKSRRELKVLEVEEERSKDYILDDQSFSDLDNWTEGLKVWHKEYYGCCDNRWKLNTVENLNLVPSSISFKEFDDYPESERIDSYF